jgi:hypothetical protein
VVPATRTGLGFLLSRIGLKGLDRCMIKNQKIKKALSQLSLQVIPAPWLHRQEATCNMSSGIFRTVARRWQRLDPHAYIKVDG